MRSGLERMYGTGGPEGQGENVIFYITVYNEPVSQPAEPDDVDVDGHPEGIHRIGVAEGDGPRVRLLASGVAVPWIDGGRPTAPRGVGRRGRHLVGHLVERAGARRRGGRGVEPAPPVGDRRGRRTSPSKLTGSNGPVVAVSDYMRAVPLQIARWVPEDYRVLGADGFGFADTRPAARRFFHIDAQSVVVQALQALADAGEIDPAVVEKAFTQYRIDDPTAVSGVLQEGGDA